MEKISTKMGYIEVTLAQLALAINFIISKFIVSDFPVMSLLLLRFFLAFGIIVLFCGLSANMLNELKHLSKRDWTLLILQALCSGLMFNLLMLYGLQYTSATYAGIINSSYPAFTALFSVLLLKEHLSKRKFLAIFCAAIGIGLLGFGRITWVSINNIELYGLFFILLAMIPGSLFSIFAKMMDTMLKPLTSTAFINGFNFLLFLPLAFFIDNREPFVEADLGEWLHIFLYCVTGGFLFFFLWYRGLSRISANTAALFIGIMPVSTTLLAYFYLSERLSWFDLIGMITVILSIFIGVIHLPKRIGNREMNMKLFG